MDKRISNFSQVAYVKRYVLTEGKESGLKVVEIDNGKIRLTLNESKALDVMQAWVHGENVAFVSKNGFSTSKDAFAKRFEGGLLYTVGLDSAGVREGFETHGSFHNIPSKIVSCVCDENKIEVTGETEDTSLFGKNLKVVRKISTSPMSDRILIEDTFINEGTRDEEYCVLYHCNFGYPFLDENVRIIYDGKNVVPRTPLAKERINEADRFLPPVDNQEERCYFIENEKPEVLLVNEKTGRKIKFFYSGETLPKLLLWQSNASCDYALGLEATTTFLDDKFEYKIIKPEQKIVNKIEISFE